MTSPSQQLRAIADDLTRHARTIERIAAADPTIRSRLLPVRGVLSIDKLAATLRAIADDIEREEAQAAVERARRAYPGDDGASLRHLWDATNAIGGPGDRTPRNEVVDRALNDIEARIARADRSIHATAE